MRHRADAAPLILPDGVRLARMEDCPPGHQAKLAPHIARSADARITVGYRQEAARNEGYTACFEANVHAPAIWETFVALVEALLPEVAAPLLGFKGEEPIKGPYTTRDAALAVFAPYARSLQHDGYLEFGIIHQRAGVTEEVFVRSFKFFVIWTSQPQRVRDVFERLGIPEVEGLEFVDSYPVVSLALRDAQDEVTYPTVIEGLQRAFAELPQV